PSHQRQLPRCHQRRRDQEPVRTESRHRCLHVAVLLPGRRPQQWRAAYERERRDDIALAGPLLPHATHRRQRDQAAIRLRRPATEAQIRRAGEALPTESGSARGRGGGEGDWDGGGGGEVQPAD
ncbi:hypothetical protein LTR53_019581, partial [Teratosphaeriaceae sp. CCFEE 6253]